MGGFSLGATRVLMAATLVGCTGGPAAPKPSRAPAPEVNARIIQYRSDEGTRDIDIQITNADTSVLRIAVRGLDWAGGAAEPREPCAVRAGADHRPAGDARQVPLRQSRHFQRPHRDFAGTRRRASSANGSRGGRRSPTARSASCERVPAPHARQGGGHRLRTALVRRPRPPACGAGGRGVLAALAGRGQRRGSAWQRAVELSASTAVRPSPAGDATAAADGPLARARLVLWSLRCPRAGRQHPDVLAQRVRTQWRPTDAAGAAHPRRVSAAPDSGDGLPRLPGLTAPSLPTDDETSWLLGRPKWSHRLGSPGKAGGASRRAGRRQGSRRYMTSVLRCTKPSP